MCSLAKEKVMYEKEAKQQEEKIEKMKAEDGENYAIKKQVKFMSEWLLLGGGGTKVFVRLTGKLALLKMKIT